MGLLLVLLLLQLLFPLLHNKGKVTCILEKREDRPLPEEATAVRDLKPAGKNAFRSSLGRFPTSSVRGIRISSKKIPSSGIEPETFRFLRMMNPQPLTV